MRRELQIQSSPAQSLFGKKMGNSLAKVDKHGCIVHFNRNTRQEAEESQTAVRMLVH
jgi:hypothetical protein